MSNYPFSIVNLNAALDLMHEDVTRPERQYGTVEPRYNDMRKEQYIYIVISRYRYIETPDITI